MAGKLPLPTLMVALGGFPSLGVHRRKYVASTSCVRMCMPDSGRSKGSGTSEPNVFYGTRRDPQLRFTFVFDAVDYYWRVATGRAVSYWPIVTWISEVCTGLCVMEPPLWRSVTPCENLAHGRDTTLARLVSWYGPQSFVLAVAACWYGPAPREEPGTPARH